MSRRIGEENVRTQQETGAAFYEASQKNLCRWPLKATKANTDFQATDITMTCSLCSDHAICYACIFSSAFEMMTHHWLVHKIAMGLAVTTAFTLRMRFTCESSSKVSRATNQPPVGSSIQLIYDVIRKSEKSCQVNTHKNKHKDFLWSVTKLQAHIKNFLNKKRCYSWQIIIVYWMEQEYMSDRNINLDTH